MQNWRYSEKAQTNSTSKKDLLRGLTLKGTIRNCKKNGT
jgi:hypothetical protein